MSGKRLYLGNCHCGAYRFQVELPAITSAHSCNCALCHKLGALWEHTGGGDIVVTKGDETCLTTYTTPSVTVKFCTHCGVVVTGQHSVGLLASKLIVNIRTVIGVNPFKLNIKQIDSKAADHPYTAHAFKGSEPNFQCDNSHLYHGSCHCGHVTVLLKAPLPPNIETRECNCSICVRVAWVGIYPRKQQVAVAGREYCREYLCGAGVQGWPFCQVCAVHVFANAYGPSEELMQTWPKERQDMVKDQWDLLPLNRRALDGVDLTLFPAEECDEISM